MTSAPERTFRFSIDRGGTFTDVFADCGNGVTKVLKLLSEDPSNYADAPREGIRRVLEQVTGVPHPRDKPLDTSRIYSIRMGTTVATNALLERKGERIALLITKGFEDLLRIGNQSRPRIFDLEIRQPELLYETVVEVDERVVLVTPDAPRAENDNVVTGITGEDVRIETAPDVDVIRSQLQAVYDSGIRSLAVVFMHAYTFHEHEQLVGRIAKEIGFTHVSLSNEVMPMVKLVPRGYTTCVDAYLTPVLLKYIRSFREGFDDNFDKVLVSFMQSDGGLTPVNSFFGNKAILSGPAGGVVGFSATGYDPATRQPLIGFDMGGTSTDVSRFAGEFEHVFESTTAGVTIQSPQLDINTVAAGGGSKLFFNNGLFVVGPDSVGAHPGPVCYRKGGELAVTDANLVLGRLLPQYFPKLFGPNENEALDSQGTRQAFERLAEEINAHAQANGMATKTVEEIALGYLQVANEAMCRPIRNLTNMKGYDVTTHALVCFGGAGPQHCCAIAKALGMRRVIVHPYSGILSAFGLSMADLVVERQQPTAEVYGEESLGRCKAKLEELENEARAELHQLGFPDSRIAAKYFLNLRYQGTDTAIMTASTAELGKDTDFRAVFEAQYMREFGFLLEGRNLLVDDIRVSVVGHTTHTAKQSIEVGTSAPVPMDHVQVFFQEGWLETPVFQLESLLAQQQITGPAVIMQDVATVIVEPGAVATIKGDGTLEIIIKDTGSATLTLERDPIYLSIFSHRFMGIAEQMGRTLQRTSVSVNIKERLDFSCALFDSAGGLVANAPHLPVHLGAMSEAVRYQIKYWGDDLAEGDVLVSNHPQLAGGSHLPDITVITPVFHNGKIVFFVASRGHHADVGGIAPGSMPPLSRTLEQEGAAIVAFKLVTNGAFQEEGITELLQAPGRLPGNSGTRNLGDNLNDLRAQVAANKRGVALMGELIAEYSLDVVQAYMEYIQQSAESAVREMLYEFSLRQKLKPIDTVHAQDFMDDGTPICLAITINRETKSAIFDFAGTGPEIFGNLNAPPSVTASAVIYCLRCLIPNMDIPLNQGCLWPVEIRIPPASILNPSATAAVVGGNVLTSQRVTDVILKAFQASAASQGCMNNLTFGDKSLGYYETIAGGAGAGPTWHGCSGVHTHMTNTRITDPEILERRLPAILREFGLRADSGGAGAYRGGDGVVRRLQFRRPLTVSILSERRAFAPFGLAGGKDALRGMNLLTFAADGRTVNLGGKNTVQVQSGDLLTILSPGGGGWGKPSDRPVGDDDVQPEPLRLESGSVNEYTRRQETA